MGNLFYFEKKKFYIKQRVFDNLFESQMLEFLKHYIQKNGTFNDINEVTKKFGQFTFNYSTNP